MPFQLNKLRGHRDALGVVIGFAAWLVQILPTVLPVQHFTALDFAVFRL